MGMNLRIALVASLALTIGACSANQTPEPEGDIIACAIGAGAEFAEVCTLEKVSNGEFVVHHPDGGFRRFTSRDGIISHDGADEGSSPQSGEEGIVEIKVDGDSYRLPSKETANQ